MSNRTVRISGTGSALVDYLYKPVSFTGENFKRFLSVNPGDGGLSPGKLVFRDEFEKFSGKDYLKVRQLITHGNPPVTLNIGGPSIVSLIHAAQMLAGTNAEVYFYGCKGRDKEASFIDENIQRTPLKLGNTKYRTKTLPLPMCFPIPIMIRDLENVYSSTTSELPGISFPMIWMKPF